ncbi:MAG: alpha/beta hydrolase [Actinomycetes bacterium]
MPTIQGSRATIHYEQVGEGPDIVWVSGGGGSAGAWDAYQLPFFKDSFRNTTFDNRGVGTTLCETPLPWSLEDFARDTAELIEAVCDPPVALVGLSLGGGIVQQVALDFPELLNCAIAMGTGAVSVGWTWDYQMAEIEFRKAGGRLDGMMAVTHYAAISCPAQVLGDRELWPKIREGYLAYYETEANEESLVAQWEPCVLYDQTDRLPDCRVPLHVIAFDQDVQAVPQDGEEVAALAPDSEFHLFKGMGHCSIYGHTHDILNPFIKGLVERYL